jgi:hypothetical protein
MAGDNDGKALPRTVRIEVFPDPSKEHGVGFRMFDSAAEKPDQATDVLIFSKAGKKTNDFHRVTFKLENTQGTNLKFARKGDALWVVEGDDKTRPSCPSTKPAEEPSGKTLRVIRRHDHELVAHNNNNEKCEFSFALGVVTATDLDEYKVIPLDPGGSNQNGGEEPLVDSSVNLNVIVGALAGVALLAVGYMILR